MNIEAKTPLLPESLDDYAHDANPVRVVDILVYDLDLRRYRSCPLFTLLIPGQTTCVGSEVLSLLSCQ
ncbi:hypothetical protein EMIT0194MI4_20419 [Pseudomonas sp. IT-194MI4]